MNIKDGYKVTEIGVIPEEWEVVEIGDKFQFKNGLNKAKEFFGYGTPIVNYMDVFNNVGLNKTAVQGKVFLNSDEVRNYSVQTGDVLFTRTSETPNEIGMSSVLLENISNAVFSGFVLRARPKDESLDNGYKKYCFRSNQVRQQIISTASYTTRALTNGRLLSVVKIPLPPLPEQKAIAEVLSDMDNLITGLERQIEKKRLVKQGAMQRLLTAGEDWEVRTLGEISVIIMGQSPIGSSYNKKGNGIPLINGPTEFTKKYPVKIQWTDKPTKYCEFNDILICVRGSSTGRMNIANDKYCIGRGVAAIRANQNNNHSFLEHRINDAIKRILALTSGSTFPNIDGKSLRSLKIPLPPLPEQTRIATILSDMDNSIASLERQLSKYRAMKVGLMQELLSGRRRLVGN